MPSFNKVLLIGNLTRDPEIRYTPKGTAVVEIGLAVNENRKDDRGNKIEEVVFVDVTLWGNTAENVNKYLSKGSACMIEGKLKLDQWEDKNSGQRRSKLKVVGLFCQFLGAPGGGQNREGDQTRQERPADHNQTRQPEPTPGGGTYLDGEDDIPF